MNNQTCATYSLEEIPATMSIQEVADFLGIGRSGAYALARSGQLEILKIGRKFRVTRHALLKYIGALT